MPIDQDWLATSVEAIIDPALPICDPHHHLWDFPGGRYLLADLLNDVQGGHNVRQTVFIECSAMYKKDTSTAMAPVGETEFVQGIAAQSASGRYGDIKAAAGIVSFADLTLGAAVAEVLDAHGTAGANRLRGIRHAAGWDANPKVRNSHSEPIAGLLLDSDFREGFACLESRELVFDAWLYHPQLMELVSLAEAFPGVTIVLDHVGGPMGIGPYEGLRSEIFQQWSHAITALAACPNVVVKLGGLGMATAGFGWHKQAKAPHSEQLAAAWAPYLLFCIEQFGVSRCMFESNFPVDKVSCSYNNVWNAFKRISADFSADEKAALFHDTAVRVYSLA